MEEIIKTFGGPAIILFFMGICWRKINGMVSEKMCTERRRRIDELLEDHKQLLIKQDKKLDIITKNIAELPSKINSTKLTDDDIGILYDL